jgi:hypothetical protein
VEDDGRAAARSGRRAWIRREWGVPVSHRRRRREIWAHSVSVAGGFRGVRVHGPDAERLHQDSRTRASSSSPEIPRPAAIAARPRSSSASRSARSSGVIISSAASTMTSVSSVPSGDRLSLDHDLTAFDSGVQRRHSVTVATATRTNDPGRARRLHSHTSSTSDRSGPSAAAVSPRFSASCPSLSAARPGLER